MTIEINKHQKIMLILIDGIGDVEQLEVQKSPLEFANTPNMDHLAYLGINGLLDPVEPGLACGSDTAHLSILGYDPKLWYRGRGSFETLGTGIPMSNGDIAFKCNFATVEPITNIILKRRADRNFIEFGPRFCDFLNDLKLEKYPDYKIVVKYSNEHRCSIKIVGPNLSDKITGTDPLIDNIKIRDCQPLDNSIEASLTCKIVNELSNHIRLLLSSHPLNKERELLGLNVANCILLRGCGTLIKDIPKFDQFQALKSFMIAPTCIIKGLGISIGMEIVDCPGGTGDYHTDLSSKGSVAVEKLIHSDCNLGFVHIKAVDDAGHDGNLELKIKFLEKIDLMVGEIIEALKKSTTFEKTEYFIVICSDHTTPIYRKDHSCEPVPLIIANLNNKGYSRDNVTKFSEVCASRGVLGRFGGIQLISLIKRYIKSNS